MLHRQGEKMLHRQDNRAKRCCIDRAKRRCIDKTIDRAKRCCIDRAKRGSVQMEVLTHFQRFRASWRPHFGPRLGGVCRFSLSLSSCCTYRLALWETIYIYIQLFYVLPDSVADSLSSPELVSVGSFLTEKTYETFNHVSHGSDR